MERRVHEGLVDGVATRPLPDVLPDQEPVEDLPGKLGVVEDGCRACHLLGVAPRDLNEVLVRRHRGDAGRGSRRIRLGREACLVVLRRSRPGQQEPGAPDEAQAPEPSRCAHRDAKPAPARLPYGPTSPPPPSPRANVSRRVPPARQRPMSSQPLSELAPVAGWIGTVDDRVLTARIRPTSSGR